MLENISSYIMYPLLLAQNKLVTPIKLYFEKQRTQQELEQLVRSLQSERDTVLAENIQLQAMLSYAEETKELAHFKKQFNDPNSLVVQVLVKHFSDQSHYFLIDKGSNSGVRPDMVAVFKNCLLGKVVEVFPHYSKVLLITDKQCKVAAYCAHTQANGIHEGNNQEQMSGLQYVSHLAEVEPEDLVLSSGDGLIFPKGFALGRIKSCQAEGLFYDVTVELLIDLRKIDYCCIMQKGGIASQLDQDVTLTAEQQITATAQEQHILELHNNLAQQQEEQELRAQRFAMICVENIQTNTQPNT